MASTRRILDSYASTSQDSVTMAIWGHQQIVQQWVDPSSLVEMRFTGLSVSRVFGRLGTNWLVV